MKCLSILLFTILFAGSEPAHCACIERLKDRIILTYSRELKTSDAPPIEGFSTARSDLYFFPAKASYVKR